MNDTNEPQILRAIRERYADGLDLLPHQTRWLINQAEQLNDARAQKPVAYMHNKRVDVIHTSVKSLLSDFAVNSGPESMLRPIDKSEHYTIPLYAAPVPAQPAKIEGCMWAVTKGDRTICQPPRNAQPAVESACVNDLVRQVALMMDDCEEHADRSITIDCDISQGFLRRIYDLLNALEDCGYDAIEPQPAAVPEAVAKDAARYRWLRRKVCIIQRSGFMGTVSDRYADFEFINVPMPTYMAPDAAVELDASIDREITEEKYNELAAD